MKNLFLLLFFKLLFQLHCHAYDVNVWPKPLTFDVHDELMRIDSNHFKINDQSGEACDIIKTAISRYLDRFFTQDCSKLNHKIGGQTISFTNETNTLVGNLTTLLIKNNGHCEKYPHINMNESYKISVNKNNAEIIANSPWGVLRALETFSQLIQPIDIGIFSIPVISIFDSPRFKHRGLLIDSSRHYLSMQSIYDTIDALEINKMNVLHWHIVDDQSFPYVSDKFPQMSQKGAYNSQTHVYTKKNVQDIIEYARLRGVRVLSEFDTPGHVESWGNSIAGLLTQCYDDDGKPNDDVGPINPIESKNYDFLKEFFQEISSRFPDQYIHLGGDEVLFDCWESNPDIKKFMSQKKIVKYEDLESYYIQKLLNIVGAMNRSYIVWQEVFDNEVKLAPETIVHVWKGQKFKWHDELEKVVTNKNYQALLSSPWYLDYISYGNDWEKYYMVEPLSFNATIKQKQLVLGGEAAIWGELVDSANLISRTWPRASAVAERLWSDENVKNLDDARDRIHLQACRMQMLGLRVQPITGPGYCPCDYAL